MKNISLICCLLGALLLTSTAAAQGAKDVATLSTIVALEQTWLKSQQTNNAEILAPLLADNIADTSTEGTLMSGRAAAIADAKSVKWSSAEYTGLRAKITPKAAPTSDTAKT